MLSRSKWSDSSIDLPSPIKQRKCQSALCSKSPCRRATFLLLLEDPEASVHTAKLQNLAAFVEGIAGKSARDDV